MEIDGIEYEASIVESNLWMVRRYAKEDFGYDEAQIRVDTANPEVAIRAAIAQGSWA